MAASLGLSPHTLASISLYVCAEVSPTQSSAYSIIRDLQSVHSLLSGALKPDGVIASKLVKQLRVARLVHDSKSLLCFSTSVRPHLAMAMVRARRHNPVLIMLPFILIIIHRVEKLWIFTCRLLQMVVDAWRRDI